MYIFIILVMSVFGVFGKLRHAVLSPMYKGEVSSFLPNLLSVLEEGSMPKVLAINVSKFTTSLYIAVEDL